MYIYIYIYIFRESSLTNSRLNLPDIYYFVLIFNTLKIPEVSRDPEKSIGAKLHFGSIMTRNFSQLKSDK